MEQVTEIIFIGSVAGGLNSCIKAYNDDGWTVQQIEALTSVPGSPCIVVLFCRSKTEPATPPATEPMKMRS